MKTDSKLRNYLKAGLRWKPSIMAGEIGGPAHVAGSESRPGSGRPKISKYRTPKIIGTTASVIAFGILGGCGLFQIPNPAATLAGDWQVKTTQPGALDSDDIRAHFDENGKLTQITATAPDGGTASLDVDDTTTTEVDGNDVTITIPAIGLEPVIEGTLSDDHNTITGNLSHELGLSHTDLVVTLPGSAITLTRIQ